MPKEKELPWEKEDPVEEEENEEVEEGEDFFTDIDDVDDQQIVFHCKPCYNFQSIEFDFIGSKHDIPEMIELYNTVLIELAKIAPAQPNNNRPVEELATEKQKDIMRTYGIKFTASTTRKEAQKLISDSISR